MSKNKRAIEDPFLEREVLKYGHPIPSREYILELLKQGGEPKRLQSLLTELELTLENEQEALRRRVGAMVRDGQLERLRNGYFWLTGHRVLVEGRIVMERERKGSIKAWVIPEDASPRIYLPLEEARTAFAGSRVIVSVVDVPVQGHRAGKLVEILEQHRVFITGYFVKEAGFCYVIPHGKDALPQIVIPMDKINGAQEGDIVVIELVAQPTRWLEPIGQVIDILGQEGSSGIEIIAVSREYGLPEAWNADVLEDIATLTESVPENAKKGRLDLRTLPLVTIDGEDAKDFDDAVYCEPQSDGGWLLYVAIADVSEYVKPNTALDEEAKTRGNSVYFPGHVIPMLPEVLSNGLCSLKPNVDRLCLVCIMTISPEGTLAQYEFVEAIMHSQARLTYNKVAALLEGSNPKLTLQYEILLPHLQHLQTLYRVLRTARDVRGAIEFENIESRILFAADGKIKRIEPVQRNEAHRIIEECMLCANVATARFLRKHKVLGLYRIHEGPAEEKLSDLRTFLGELGLSLGNHKIPQAIDYAQFLKSVQDRPDAHVIQTVLLRSMGQAVYSPDNVGHFGLAYPAYCHFTSPIRRYPDLLVHRQIRSVLRGAWNLHKISHEELETAKEALGALGTHCSMTERRADDAVRDVIRWLKCQYIKKHLGESFEGIISGVTRFGFFVELKDLYIDGLVHMGSLQDDYYYYESIHHRLVGERTHKIYSLGETVRVRIQQVNVAERKIDFELLEEASTHARKKTASKSHSGAQRKHASEARSNSKPGTHSKRKKPKKKEQ